METFGPVSDLETGSNPENTEQPLMLESSVATTSDYGALAALLQVYDERDCWCGEGFADVVEQFIACPPKLDDPEYPPTDDDRVRFRDLYAM